MRTAQHKAGPGISASSVPGRPTCPAPSACRPCSCWRVPWPPTWYPWPPGSRTGPHLPGGYGALTQREPSPEGTATVLQALHRIDGTARLCAQLDTMKANIGDVERSRPYILTTMLKTSRQLDPDPELTAGLIRDLLDARRPYGDLLLWPEKAEPLAVSPAPSIAHTARAVRALAQVGQPAPEVRAALEQAAAWLTGQRDLGNVSENIDRLLEDGRVEELYTRHFTSRVGGKGARIFGLSRPATQQLTRPSTGSGTATTTRPPCGAGTTATCRFG